MPRSQLHENIDKIIEGTIKNIAFLTGGISVFYEEKQFQNKI